MDTFQHTPEQRKAINSLFTRYSGIIAGAPDALSGLPEKCMAKNLQALCTEAIENSGKYPFDKLNRWLGFVQGVLAATELIDVDTERDFTRPILHSFHEKKPSSFSS